MRAGAGERHALAATRLVTVFGGSGFVGRYAVRALAQAGYRMRAAFRRPDLAGFLQPMGDVGQVQAVQANLRYAGFLRRAVEGATSSSFPSACWRAPARRRSKPCTSEGARRSAKAAREAGAKRFVHISAIGASA